MSRVQRVGPAEVKPAKADEGTEGNLTLSHSLEVQLSTVASKTRHSASPDLEHVDGALLEATDDHCVGWAPDDSRIQFRVVLEDDKHKFKKKPSGLTVALPKIDFNSKI